MRVIEDTLDDALRALYPALLASTEIVLTSRGETRELIGVLIEITKPRARLSRTETRGKPFSCLGELLWYLSGNNRLEFIHYYIQRYDENSEDGTTVFGGYGPRLFAHRNNNQVANVTKLLQSKPNTRRAVIQLFDAEDISQPRVEIPCTTTLQFLLRDTKLHLIVNMRSNDAYVGLPHDVFCFTMLQEIVSRSIGADIGIYRHFAGSMHIYERHTSDAKTYLTEGVQRTIEMPEMPEGNPWPAIGRMLEAERRIRASEQVDASKWGVDAYWADLIRLLQIFAATGDEERINELKSAMNFTRYGSYIDARK
jgi:thymidylate synthase